MIKIKTKINDGQTNRLGDFTYRSKLIFNRVKSKPNSTYREILGNINPSNSSRAIIKAATLKRVKLNITGMLKLSEKI